MADDIVIRAERLGKKYVIGHEAQRERYVALRDVIARGARNAWRMAKDMAKGRVVVPGDTVEEFWALRDVNFEVRRGEVLGIIGRNGAGKSTLLKILSRITEPSEGRVTIRGRVASLLEVGTGFHPELTGRENIFLNGAVLGMTRAEIKRKFDEIVAFADVEKFLDTPVKRYSSGMYVRLAFSVAAHLEPEILVVDEVLAVGDAEFQKKCLGKMQDVAGHGRTVLFVSHNMSVIERLCERCVILRDGLVDSDGDARPAVRRYLNIGNAAREAWPLPERRRGNGKARFKDIHCPLAISFGDTITVDLAIAVKELISSPDIRCLILNANGAQVANFASGYLRPSLPPLTEDCVIRLTIPDASFTVGSYTGTVTIAETDFNQPVIADRIEAAFQFDVAAADPFGTGIAPTYGSVVMPHEWEHGGRHVSSYRVSERKTSQFEHCPPNRTPGY